MQHTLGRQSLFMNVAFWKIEIEILAPAISNFFSQLNPIYSDSTCL